MDAGLEIKVAGFRPFVELIFVIGFVGALRVLEWVGELRILMDSRLFMTP